MSTIGFIGGGNIVSAILSGAEQSEGFNPGDVAVFDINVEVRGRYQSKGYEVCTSITALVESSSIVVLAVKPQVMESIMPEVRAAITPAKVLVSVAAGIGSGWLAEQTGTRKVIRCMPNTPAQMKTGALALSRGEEVGNRDFAAVRRFFERCGLVEEIPESLMCEITAVSGSTPAFFYRMAHVMVGEAVAMGFEEAAALRLFAQTMKGSAQMLMDSGLDAVTLARKVCSPGGTTLAALSRMDELGFNNCLREGMRACVARCKEMGK